MAYWHNFQDIVSLQKSLKTGYVSLGSSDTIFGLFAALTEEGFLALNQIKNRDQKPYIVLVSSLEKAITFSDDLKNNQKLYNFLKKIWPGPVTIIAKANPEIPNFLKSAQNTIALRVPNHQGLQVLLQNLPGVFSTSANLANKPAPKNFSEVSDEILAHIDYSMLDDAMPLAKPSTILDCTGEFIKVIREGAYSINLLEHYYGTSFSK